MNEELQPLESEEPSEFEIPTGKPLALLGGSQKETDTFRRQFPEVTAIVLTCVPDLRHVSGETHHLIRVGNWFTNPLCRNLAHFHLIKANFPGWDDSPQYQPDNCGERRFLSNLPQSTFLIEAFRQVAYSRRMTPITPIHSSPVSQQSPFESMLLPRLNEYPRHFRERDTVEFFQFQDGSELRRIAAHRLLVVAGNGQEYRDWCRRESLNPNTCHYVFNMQNIRGLRPEDFFVIRVGQWWNNPIAANEGFRRHFPDLYRSPVFLLDGLQSETIGASYHLREDQIAANEGFRQHFPDQSQAPRQVQIRFNVDASEIQFLSERVREAIERATNEFGAGLRSLLQLQEALAQAPELIQQTQQSLPKSCSNCAYCVQEPRFGTAACNAFHDITAVNPRVHCCPEWRDR